MSLQIERAVLPTLVISRDLLSSQWALVIGLGLIFFLVQVLLSVSFYLRMGRQERVIKRLCRDYKEGGDGRTDVRPLPRKFVWINWVLSNFPDDTAHPPNNYTREDVLQELDTRISSNGDYLLLQRMGVMAPLLGVVLTVAGFYWLNVAKEDQSLQSILMAVTPLVSGVGTGAVLALINQVLLHIVGQRVESLRMSARSWFDTVIWNQSGREAQASANAVQALERFACSVSDAAERYTDNSKSINAAATSMTDGTSHFREVAESFTAEIEGVLVTLRDVRRSTAASATALEDLIRVGSRAVSNLDVSVAAFRTTLDREFAAAAKLHRRSARALAETVQQITCYAKTSVQLSEFVTESIAPATRQLAEFCEALSGLNSVVDGIKSGDNVPADGQRLSDQHVGPAGSAGRIASRVPGKPR